MPPILPRALHIVFAGNPGVGKSFILNSLIGTITFRSGVKVGEGLTQALQTHEDPRSGNKYSDTPGLDDISIREKAASEISNALRAGGTFKLIFVCTLEEGRVRPADVTTIDIILKAIKDVNVDPTNRFSVIVNKCNEGVMKQLDSIRTREKLRGHFCRTFPLEHIQFFRRINDAAGQEDFLLSDGDMQQYMSFVEKAPTLELPPNSGVTIDVSNFEDIKKKFEKELAELREKLRTIEHVRDNDKWLELAHTFLFASALGASSTITQLGAEGKITWLNRMLSMWNGAKEQ